MRIKLFRPWRATRWLTLERIKRKQIMPFPQRLRAYRLERLKLRLSSRNDIPHK